MEDLDYFHFYYSKKVALDLLNKKIIYFYFEDRNYEAIIKSDLHEAKVLLQIIKRQVDEYNATIKSSETKLRKLNFYKDFYKSAFFKGVKISEIRKLIEQTPRIKEIYDYSLDSDNKELYAVKKSFYEKLDDLHSI